ncbi:MAG: hypothetical protein L6R35_001783 [Caloplaca aegaea]|nr:MAG: hypothetical protein L6R35_001783 [Caloplaca aegaea]
MTVLCSILDTRILDLDFEASFIQNGGHSLAAAAFASMCKARGYDVTSKSILTSRSIRHFLSSIGSNTTEQADSFETTITDVGKNVEPPFDLKNLASPEQPAFPVPSPTAALPSDLQSNGSIPSKISLLEDESQDLPYSSASSLDDDEGTQGTLTALQLTLIHGTLKTPGMNVISYAENFYSRDIPAVKLAWKTVIDMEPIFRYSAFKPYRGNSYQHFTWHEESSHFSPEQIRNEIEKIRSKSGLGSAFYVFPQGSMNDSNALSTVAWIVHHSFVDGYSTVLLLDKVRRVTAGIMVKPSRLLPEFYIDLQDVRRSRKQESIAYWTGQREILRSANSQLLLPATSQTVNDSQCDDVVVDLKALRNGLASLSKEASVTRATIFNAAWALVLSKFSGSTAVKFGVILSGRDIPLAGVMEIIGPLINTLPLCINIDPDSPAKDLLRTTMKTLVDLGEHHWATPENGFCNNFESALAVQFDQMEPPNNSIQPIGERITQQATDIPLSIMVERESNVRFVFRQERFCKKDIAMVGTCFYRVLQLLLHRDITVGGVMQGLLPISTRNTLLQYGNCISDRTTRPSITQDLVTLFEQAAKNAPDSVAVEQGDQRLTYGNLDGKASRLGKYLSAKVRPGDIVCVNSDRSINWIIIIYGILKAQATYCSLDSGLPPKLRDTMFTNAEAKVFVLPNSAQRAICPESSGCNIALDEALKEITDGLNHREEPTPWSTAYLCFTSGSTGTPKGVLCTHGSLVAFQSELEVRLYAQPGIKVSQVMSPAFDGSIHEIFSALSYGATLVLPLQDDQFSPLTSVHSALLTPSIARAIDPDNYPQLSNVYLVGEQVPQTVNNKWAKTKNLYNMYGPTEGTCGSTIKRLMPDRQITIGRPNPTTRVYILDERHHMAFPGVIGEIYVAGVQVAEGYLSLPDATRDRFLPDTIMCNGEKMYKTGDKGYWSESGEVVYQGRDDRQIKFRGFRLDMNDLEIRVARELPEMEAVAITAQGDHLVAMVQPASTDISKLRSRIAMVLPSYAVPRQIIATDSLPTTRAGKIDYKTMSEAVVVASTHHIRTPHTTTEKAVAKAFRAVLELDDTATITAHSNFIDLGGHSLHQLSLSFHLTRHFDIQIPLQLVIEHPEIEDLAKSIDTFVSARPPPMPPLQQLYDTSVALTEEDWLNRYQFDAGSSSFNVSFSGTFDSKLVDRSRLAHAWDTVLAGYPILSCRYVERRAKAPRRTYSDIPPRVQHLTSLDLWTEVNRPFDLYRSSPIRVSITGDRLVVVLSHIVADYTTLAIILKEVSQRYDNLELPHMRHEYHTILGSKEVAKPCHLDFWSDYLKDCEDPPALFGRRIERDNYRGTSVISRLPSTAADKVLLACTDSTSYTPQHLVTAAVALCLHQPEAGCTDVVIGTPHINRDTVEALETVGLFLQPLPVRVKYDPHPQKLDGGQDSNIDPNEAPISFLDSVRESSQAALAHAVPWHQLLTHLGVRNTYPDHPLSDVMVSFHDSRQAISLSIRVPGFEPCLVWSEGSKFKLMCEFTALPSGSILLRLEYDPKCIKLPEIAMLQRCLPHVLDSLVRGSDYETILKWLAEERKVDGQVEKIDLFGANLNRV